MESIPKPGIAISRDHFEKLWSFAEKGWLRSSQSALFELLASCQTPSQSELVFELIERFTYHYDEDFDAALSDFFTVCVPVWGLSTGNTVIAALHNDKHADSSQGVLHSIKQLMKDSSLPNFMDFISPFQAAHHPNALNLVLVDDFIGSGDQAIRVISSLNSHMINNGLTPNLYVFSVAAMERSHKIISKKVVDYYACAWLKKGISDYCKFDTRKKKIKDMIALEGELEKEIIDRGRKRKLYSLGYKHSEALYKRHRSTTPNNVFPIFHWPWLANGGRRKTILPAA